MGRDLGQVQPPSHGNRWSWPFHVMEAGDFFVVDQVDKPKGQVANIVKVSAYRLGKQFSIVEHPEQPGMTLVTCKDWSEGTPVKASPKPVKTPAEFWKLMDRCAGLDPNSEEMDFWLCRSWERKIDWQSLPAVREHVVTMPGGDRYRFTFKDNALASEFLGNVSAPLAAPGEEPKDDWYGYLAGDTEKRKLLD